MSAKDAIKAEAVQEDLMTEREFEFEGHTYTVPSADDWSIEAVEAFEDGKHIGVIRSILGPTQWRLYKQRHPKAKTAASFIEAMFADVGVPAGE